MKFSLSKEIVLWILSYLSQRYQRVVSGVLSASSWVPVTSGVPQGSVIGPLLFCLVMDSLSVVCPNSRLIMYADDITLLHFIRDQSEDNLQLEIDNVNKWCKSHKLYLNSSKCNVMDIVTSTTMSCTPVYMQQKIVANVKYVKILGCILSHDLKWIFFIDSLIKKASKRIYLMLCLKRAGCSPEVMFRCYSALIRPILLYAYPAWCNLPVYLQKRLLIVERRVLRIVNLDFEPPSLFLAGDKMCLKLFTKVAMESEHPLRCFFEERCDRARDLRGNSILRRPKCKTKRFSNSFIKFCL